MGINWKCSPRWHRRAQGAMAHVEIPSPKCSELLAKAALTASTLGKHRQENWGLGWLGWNQNQAQPCPSFIFQLPFILGKCRDVDGNRLCISPAAENRNGVSKAKITGQISHKVIFTVISLVYWYHSWLQFPSPVHLWVLSCVGISVLSAGSCWSYQGSLENNPLQNTNKRILM